MAGRTGDWRTAVTLASGGMRLSSLPVVRSMARTVRIGPCGERAGLPACRDAVVENLMTEPRKEPPSDPDMVVYRMPGGWPHRPWCEQWWCQGECLSADPPHRPRLGSPNP